MFVVFRKGFINIRAVPEEAELAKQVFLGLNRQECRKGGLIGILDTLVPIVLYPRYLIHWLKNYR